nr:reverse transcriptase domain-containing protein [Tanacetum cinerariifolium]
FRKPTFVYIVVDMSRETWLCKKDTIGILAEALQERHQGTLPSVIIPNPRGEIKLITTRSGNVLAGPSVPPLPLSSSKEVERDPKTITDQVLPESTTRVPPPVVQPSLTPTYSELPPPPTSSFELFKRNPHRPPIPYPLRMNKDKLQDKSDIQIHKFLQMFKKLHFNISLAEALALMPKYVKMLKYLLFDKEKILGFVNTSLTENCSAVLLKKLPEKLGDPVRFLIPCDFHGLESCMALADLGAGINLMPLSVWKKLSLIDLTPTRMTLELATRSIVYPAGIAEDVCVQVEFAYEPSLVDSFPSEKDDDLFNFEDDDDDLFDLRSDNKEWKKLLYGDSFKNIDFEKNKSKDSKMKLLIDEANIVELINLLPPSLDCDSTLHEELHEIDTVPSFLKGNEDKVFNPSILVHGSTHLVINEVTYGKNLKEKTSFEAPLILEDSNFLSLF